MIACMQYVNVVPQDEQHSWYTVHSKNQQQHFRSRCEGSISDELLVAMWGAVDAILQKRSVLGVQASGQEISKNGDRQRTKNRKCHDISPRTLRQAISTPGGQSPDRSSEFMSVCHQSVPQFWHLLRKNKQTFSNIYMDNNNNNNNNNNNINIHEPNNYGGGADLAADLITTDCTN